MTQDRPAPPPPDPIETWAKLASYTARAQRIFLDYMAGQGQDDGFSIPDPRVVADTFTEAAVQMMANPAKLAQAQFDLMRRQTALWEAAVRRLSGEPAEPVAQPAKGDKRFADEAWNQEPLFDVVKQAYLLTADWLQRTMRDVDGLDPRTRAKLEFYTRQFVDAMAPSNFVLTNPKVLRATVETGGDNLLKGMENLLADLERGHGRLAISMTDYDAFRLGENIATTPGKVVFQNDLMQLIQYAPATEQVFKRPLLIVPPWINKYYILDLRPKNSFIRWCVEQGHTVFVISWVNPDERLSNKGFEDYMLEGPLAALDAIGKATGEESVNLVGYCIGGTLSACTLSWMAAKGDRRVASATFLTTTIDYSKAGELLVFIDDEQLELLDRHMAEKGYLEGRHMAQVFNLMRDNDLIWSFVVNNYLLGREPFPFDLLYWNSDATRMPAMMHSFYLRRLYNENRLIEPGGISLAGVSIDLGRIELPTYILATREDHIAPWKSAYAATQAYSGPRKFVLSASGHIAGVVNPPSAKKYCHWLHPRTPADAELWLAKAKQVEGSWWTDWQAWVKRHGGRKVPARRPGDGALKPIEDAPGSYVKVRLAD